MKIETWTEFLMQDGLGGYLEIAGADGIDRVEEFHQIAGMDHAAVGSEIAGTILDHTARKKDFRKVIGTYAYPRIGLGVLEKDIVAGLELLYEVVLQKKCVSLRLYDRILSIGNLGDHDRSLSGQAVRRDEILSDSLVKVLCLAHIYDIPLGVIITVDSGGMREQ